jgi:hypothetical protein
MNILRAILNIRPGSFFEVNGDTYDGVVWKEPPEEEGGQTKPTKEEVIAEIERLQAEYEYNEYQRLRAKEYPSFADQLDLLYHGGYDVWKTEIDKVKEKYPKP